MRLCQILFGSPLYKKESLMQFVFTFLEPCVQRRLCQIFLRALFVKARGDYGKFNNEGTIYNIKKPDGTNFSFWKEQVFDVLVQKKQAKSIKYKGKKPDTMSWEDWEDMDAMTRSTIMLFLSKDVY